MKKPILCKFEPELIETLKRIAKEQNRPLNNLIETVLMEFVKKRSDFRDE